MKRKRSTDNNKKKIYKEKFTWSKIKDIKFKLTNDDIRHGNKN